MIGYCLIWCVNAGPFDLTGLRKAGTYFRNGLGSLAQIAEVVEPVTERLVEIVKAFDVQAGVAGITGLQKEMPDVGRRGAAATEVNAASADRINRQNPAVQDRLKLNFGFRDAEASPMRAPGEQEGNGGQQDREHQVQNPDRASS